MNTDLPHMSVCMVLPALAGVPGVPIPPPYSFRPYRPGDEAAWVRIHELTDPLNVASRELFEKQFGRDEAELRRVQANNAIELEASAARIAALKASLAAPK